MHRIAKPRDTARGGGSDAVLFLFDDAAHRVGSTILAIGLKEFQWD